MEPEFESYKENNVYKNRFIGYKFTHVMKLEFESDNKRMGRILFTLAHCPLHPEFRISYTVKDPEAVKNEMLGKAVRDAVAKAGVLSTAAGVKLGEIQNVDYSWGEINFEIQAMRRVSPAGPMMADEGCSYDMDIEPDDIDAEDTVTVIWEIL